MYLVSLPCRCQKPRTKAMKIVLTEAHIERPVFFAQHL